MNQCLINYHTKLIFLLIFLNNTTKCKINQLYLTFLPKLLQKKKLVFNKSHL